MAEKQPPQEVEIQVNGVTPDVVGRDGKKRCVVDLTYWTTDGQEVPAQASTAPWDTDWLQPAIVERLKVGQIAKVLLSWRGQYIDFAGIPGVERPANRSTGNGAGGEQIDRMRIRMHVQNVVAQLGPVIKSTADWDKWYEHLTGQVYGKRPEAARPAAPAARASVPPVDGL